MKLFKAKARRRIQHGLEEESPAETVREYLNCFDTQHKPQSIKNPIGFPIDTKVAQHVLSIFYCLNRKR